MKNNFIYIAIFFMALFGFSYGKNGVLNDECKNNFSPACLALLEQAKKENNKENITLYKTKLLDIMESACKKDYQTCLVLSRIYEENENAAIQAIKKDIQAQKIPAQIPLPDSNYANETKKFFTDTESIVSLMREKPDQSKALQYQERAVNMLEHTCYDSNVGACLYLRYFYEYGIGVAQNRPKAERLINLALDFATKECVLGDMQSCKLLNPYKEYREKIAKDLGELNRKCDEKDSIACYQISLYYTQDFYISDNVDTYDDKSDFVKAARFLQKACKLDTNACDDTIFNIKYAKECIMDNDMKACASVQNVRPEFFSLACDSGDMTSCYELRYLPTFNDVKRYVKLLQRICRGGIIESCTELANMYENGDRVAKNKEKALGFMQRACAWSMKKGEAGNHCYFAGLGYERGEYVKQDIEKAIEAYQYACQISDENSAACERLGVLHENYRQDMRSALKWYEKACNLNKDSVISCMQLAKHSINGEYLAINEKDSIRIYEELLEHKDAPHDEIYYNLANIYSTFEFQNKNTHTTKENSHVNYAKALQYYKRACSLGLQNACKKKLTLPNLAQECKAENANSCYQLATLLELIQKDSSYQNMLIMPNKDSLQIEITNNTKPLAKDNDKTLSLLLYKQACKGNVAEACIRFYNETKGVFEKDFVLQESMCKNLKALPLDQMQDSKNIDSISKQNKTKTQERKDSSNDLGTFSYSGTQEQGQDEKDSKPVKTALNAKSICLDFAKDAIKESEYQKAINALEPYQTKDDAIALDLLAKAYFYAKEYNKTFDTYKRIYALDTPNDYFYLAQMYANGFGVRQSYEKAMDIYKLSPSAKNYHSARSYLGLAEMYANGLGVQKSIFNAKDYYKLACPLDTNDEAKVANEACANLGSIIYNEGDFRTAQKYYLKACEMGYNGDIISCDKK